MYKETLCLSLMLGIRFSVLWDPIRYRKYEAAAFFYEYIKYYSEWLNGFSQYVTLSY